MAGMIPKDCTVNEMLAWAVIYCANRGGRLEERFRLVFPDLEAAQQKKARALLAHLCKREFRAGMFEGYGAGYDDGRLGERKRD